MKDGRCPKCGSLDIIPTLRVHAGKGFPPYVDLTEPEPEQHPFAWIPKGEQSNFMAYVCGKCGYTEFYATSPKELNEAHKKGYKSS